MAAPTEIGADEFLLVPIEQLHESPKNPRTHYEPLALKQLADNLKAVGQITPVIVRPRPNGKSGYEIAAGHRRARAAKLAGLTALTAVVRDLDEAQFVEILNIENLQRDDLNALEEAQGFVALMTDAGYDVPKIAERVGRSIKYVYDRIKLLQLIPEAKKLLLAGTITPGHGILLARLNKEDQKRALIPDDTYRGGGMLERERIDGSYFAHREPELDLQDPKKARSVRELAQWIDRNVRFVPGQSVAQADLAFDMPDTARLLGEAKTNKLKVVKITREYRVPDEARDEKERTYGTNGWKRADGEPEDSDSWDPHRKTQQSKTCDHSVVGLVVAGPGRGEAFRVCVNKDRCPVHWAEEMKARAKRAKARERATGENGNAEGRAPKAKKVDPNILPDGVREDWEEQELAARAPDIVKAVKGIIAELKISDEICWNLVRADLDLYHWNKVGKTGWGGHRTQHSDELEPLLGAELPGRFAKGSLRAEDGPGARSELAWMIWVARESGDLDQSIEKAVSARWAAQRKAAAKQADVVQTSGKTKKRAGDVARARKAKATKGAR